jgi:hypothetical protein
MGNVLHIWFTVLWTWVILTIIWFATQPLVHTLMDVTEVYMTTSMELTTLAIARFSHSWFPGFLFIGMLIWGLWASQKRDPEYQESYHGY